MIATVRRQFVLDGRTDKLLRELAAERAGNHSFVVREAIQLYAALESALEETEADPGFRRMMERTAADIHAGRLLSHAEGKRRLRKSSRRA